LQLSMLRLATTLHENDGYIEALGIDSIVAMAERCSRWRVRLPARCPAGSKPGAAWAVSEPGLDCAATISATLTVGRALPAPSSRPCGEIAQSQTAQGFPRRSLAVPSS